MLFSLAVPTVRDAAAEPAELIVDPAVVRQIDGISELDRTSLFNLGDPGKGFESRVKSSERLNFLINDLNVSFGRALGPVRAVTDWGPGVEEDPRRPGHADLKDLASKLAPEPAGQAFRKTVGDRMQVAAHGSVGAYPEFMGIEVSEQAASSKHAKDMPKNIEAAAELAAVVMARNYTDFDRPRFYEPINEPHWAHISTEHLARWHVATKKAVQKLSPEVRVGGPCLSVAYFYKRNFNGFNGLRDFMKNTGGELDFYSFHVYDYMNWNGQNLVGRVTGGLPLEGVLDLVQAHTVHEYGRPVDIVVSEHGGYITGSTGPNTEELGDLLAAQHFPDGEGFEHTMRKRSIGSHVLVSAAIANTLTFMDHPHTVKKAVPFILLESMGWDPTYYSTAYVPRDFTDKDDWVESRNLDFYKFFRDLGGRRVVVRGGDPDVQARAFVRGKRLQIVLNNLSDEPQTLALRVPEPGRVAVRRYGRNEDFTPYLTESDLASLDGFTLAGREAALITAQYPAAFGAEKTVNEVPYYSQAIATEIAGEKPASFRIALPDVDGLEYASLRIGVTRPSGASPDLRVVFNGKRVDVPLEDAAERLTTADEYASTKIVEIDPAWVKKRNTVLVAFPDDMGGAIGSVVLRAGLTE